MLLNQVNRLAVLNQMGIPVWLRTAQPNLSASASFQAYALQGASTAACHYLILDAVHPADENVPAIQALLNKMLAAIKVHLSSEINPYQLIVELAKQSASRFLVMGDVTVKSLFGLDQPIAHLRKHNGQWTLGEADTVIVTYHPKQLLNHKELKRQAWDDLKLFVHYI